MDMADILKPMVISNWAFGVMGKESNGFKMLIQ